MQFAAIWATCLCGLFSCVLSEQFFAAVAKRASLDLSCGFAADGLFSLTLPQKVSSDLFGNSLQLRVSLPQGTRIVDSKITAIWQGKTVQALAINRDFGVLEFSVVLKAGQLVYEVMIQNDQSIVNPAFLGPRPLAFQFLPAFSMNTIFGAVNVTYSTGPVHYEAWYEQAFTNVFTRLIASFDLNCVLRNGSLNNVTVKFTSTNNLPATFERLKDCNSELFYLNEQDKAAPAAAFCTSEELENSTSLLYHGVSLEQVFNPKLNKVVVQLSGIFSHRTHGWSCHLTLSLLRGQDLFYELNLCVEIKYPSPWPRVEVSALQLPILKQSNYFKVQLTADVVVLADDELTVSIPAELQSNNPLLLDKNNFRLEARDRSFDFAVVNSSCIRATGIALEKLTALQLRIVSLNGSAESSQNFSFSFTLSSADGNLIYQSTTPSIEFVPLLIWVRSQKWTEAPQRKGTVLDYELTLEFEFAPTREYSKLELAFPTDFNILATVSPLQGFNPNWGLKKVNPYTIGIFNQLLADARPLFDTQKISFRLSNLEIPKKDLSLNQVVFRLFNAKTVGFQGTLHPWLDLVPNKLLLEQTNVSLSAGSISLLLSFEIDATMVNSLDLVFQFNSTLGYFSTDERLCSVQIQNASRTCSVDFNPVLQNQTFSVKRAFIPRIADGGLVLNLTIGLENEVVPSILNLTCSMFSESGRQLFEHNWTNLTTGCFEGCAVCYSNDTQKCMKCLPNYDTSNETGCELRVPRVPYFELLKRINTISRTTTVSIVLAGVALTFLMHLFIVKTSGGEVSPYIIDKICISNVSSLAMWTVFVRDLIDSEDNREAVFTQWVVRIFITCSFFINCAAFCAYQSLSHSLAFMSLRNRRWTSKATFSLAALVLGFHNLLQFCSNVRILSRLKSAATQQTVTPAPTKSKYLHQGFELQLIRTSEGAGNDGAKKELPRRRSNSSNLDHGDHLMEVRSVKSSEDKQPNRTSKQKPLDQKTKQPPPTVVLPEFGLLDLFEMLRWLNIGAKGCLLLVCLVISATCAARFWSWDRPCELYAVLLFELCLYLIPLARIEPSWQTTRNEAKALEILQAAEKEQQAAQQKDEEAESKQQSSLMGESKSSLAQLEAPKAQQAANRAGREVERKSLYELTLDSMLEKSKQTLEDLVNEDSSDTDSYMEGFNRYLRDTGTTQIGPKTKFNYFIDMMKRGEEFPLRKSSEGSDEDSDFEFDREEPPAQVQLAPLASPEGPAASEPGPPSQQP